MPQESRRDGLGSHRAEPELSRMKTLAEIEVDVGRLAALVGASGSQLPSYGRTRDGGYPHVEVDADRYHYVHVERGQECSRLSSANLDDLLYWACADMTHGLAFAFEGRHRVAGQDTRRIAFARQLELLGLASPAMAQRRALEIEQVLARSPYQDDRGAGRP
jgi:hypothetical protein